MGLRTPVPAGQVAGWVSHPHPTPMTDDPDSDADSAAAAAAAAADPAAPAADPAGSVPGYPVVLDLSGHRCLVVGGGPVAARRLQGLMAAGAVVTVVAPDLDPSIEHLAAGGSLDIERRPYRSGEAGRYRLVLTATGDPEVDRAVVDDAVAAGVPVNSADRRSPGTMHLPAVQRRGTVTVAVSTGGLSPALARWLGDRLTASLPARVELLGALLDEARESIRSEGRSTDSVDWPAVLNEVVPLVEAGRTDEARAVLSEL